MKLATVSDIIGIVESIDNHVIFLIRGSSSSYIYIHVFELILKVPYAENCMSVDNHVIFLSDIDNNDLTKFVLYGVVCTNNTDKVHSF
jgi:hypothetical protein